MRVLLSWVCAACGETGDSGIAEYSDALTLQHEWYARHYHDCEMSSPRQVDMS